MFANHAFKKVLILIAVLYLALAGVMIWRSSTVAADGGRYFSLFDDAMISMRYADNFASGHGLVWNQMAPSERVEGFTNPLMVLVMAACIAMFGKFAGVFAVQFLGFVLLVINIWLIMQIASRLTPHDTLRDISLFFVGLFSLTFYPLMYWSIMGMETGLLTTLVLFAVWLIVREPTQELRLNWKLAVVLALCYLTRPDSVLLIAVVYIFRLIERVRSLPTFLRLAAEAAITALPLIGYQLFRLSYYGHAFPNTYILKATGLDIFTRIQNGFLFSVPFLRQFSPLLIVAVIALVVLISHRHQALRTRLQKLFTTNRSHILLCFALFCTYLVYQVCIGGDAWPPYWRFIVPYVPLFFIALMAVSSIAAHLIHDDKKQFTILFAALLALNLLYAGKAYVYDLVIDLRPYQAHANDSNVNTALAIKALTTDKATIAPFWAGTIPYYSDRYAIDPLGKMDEHIASLPADISGGVAWGGMITVPGHNKYDLNYTIKELQPDVLQYIGSICTWGNQNLKRWCDERYDLVPYDGIELLLKKDSPNVRWEMIKK
jgi:hypothetical protein